MTELIIIIVLIIFYVSLTLSVKAQDVNMNHCVFEMQKKSQSKGAINVFTTIDQGWCRLSDNSANDDHNTSFAEFENSANFSRIGGVIEPDATRKVIEPGEVFVKTSKT